MNFKQRPFWNRLINNLFPCIKTIRVFYGWILKINLTKIYVYLYITSYFLFIDSLYNTLVTW